MAERRRPMSGLSDNNIHTESLYQYAPNSTKYNSTEKLLKSMYWKVCLGCLLIFTLVFPLLWLGSLDKYLIRDDGQDYYSNDEAPALKTRALPVNYRTGGASKKINGHEADEEVAILLTFTNVRHNPHLRVKLQLCVSSMLNYTSARLVILVIGDTYSQDIAAEIINTASETVHTKADYRMVLVDIDSLVLHLHTVVKEMQQHFSYKPGAYYSDNLFFLSLAIHRVMPDSLQKVIMLDADLKFQADVAQLYGHFDRFAKSNIIGIVREMQPVYRHILHVYRNEHPGTRVGSSPPDGLAGFNSGVLLLDIKGMRQSQLYNSLLDPEFVKNLTIKYKFKGHLGDQDFFTLISLEHEELFYMLPCTWNRQLCQWWRDKGYEDVFDEYFHCEGHVNIYHGNCNTAIPA